MSIFIDTLKGQKTHQTPVWLMRQAGRHLPEYTAIRKKHSSLLEMFLNKETICRVTLQPVERYRVDAAILFSDILMVPYSLGFTLSFKEGGIGPVLAEPKNELNQDLNLLKPIFQGVEKIKKETDNRTPLIGFTGGVWTTIYFSIFNKEERNQVNKKLILSKKDKIESLINDFTNATIKYTIEQINHGIDAFQIFESAAGVLTDEQFERWCLVPTQKILNAIENKIPVIGFPKNASLQSYVKYTHLKNLNAVSIDEKFKLTNIPQLNQSMVFQGNLNPKILLDNKDELVNKTEDILLAFRDYPHIFNLGHGVLPNTPIENVEAMINKIRNFE